MARGTQTVYPGKRNKGLSSICQPPEEGWSVQRPKHCDKDEDNSPKNVNNVHNTESQRCRQIFSQYLMVIFISHSFKNGWLVACILWHLNPCIPDIGIMVRVFANGPGDLGSIPSRVIPKTQKMVLDASLLNTQHYKVRIKGKVEQSRERSSALPYTLV